MTITVREVPGCTVRAGPGLSACTAGALLRASPSSSRVDYDVAPGAGLLAIVPDDDEATVTDDAAGLAARSPGMRWQ